MWTHLAQLQLETGGNYIRVSLKKKKKSLNVTRYSLRYCWSSCSVPGVAGWLGVAGCGFPTISICLKTDRKEIKAVITWNKSRKV